MEGVRRVALNGVWLDEVDDRIVISGIEPGEGKENISTTETAAGFGQRVISRKRTTLDIVIRFRMLEHGKSVDGMNERAELLEKINGWAASGGELRVNYKPNRRLTVVLAQAPGEGSLWDYTKEYTMTFRAYAVPYWEERTANSQSVGGSAASKSMDIAVEGNTETQANVLVENTSGAKITKVELTIAGKKMTFDGMEMVGSEALVIDHVDGLFRARIRSALNTYRSAMAYRTTGSVNDFTMAPGTRTCTYSATRACKMTVTWRSRFL